MGDLTMRIHRLRDSTRQKLIDSLPPDVAENVLTLIKRIEQSRNVKINAACIPLTTEATIQLKDDDTILITSPTRFNTFKIRAGTYIFLHETGDYFVPRNCVMCYVQSLHPYELTARIMKKKSPNYLENLNELTDGSITLRIGVHHSSLNVHLYGILWVAERKDLYEKLFPPVPKVKDDLNLPDFRGHRPVELPESVVNNVSKLTPEQMKAMNALTRQSSKTLIISGAPGTGKTFVLIEGALKLIAAGARILFVSTYCVLADIISEEFVKRGLTDNKIIFRALGNARDAGNLSEGCLKFSECIQMPPVQDIQGCSIVITSFSLLFKTCAINRDAQFTHIFIDGAHFTKKSVWEALYLCGHPDVRLVLCGNPYHNYFKHYTEKSLETPLFRILSNTDFNADPNLMVALTENHRSHKAIVDILARLCYEDNLKSAESDEHGALCNWEFLPNPRFPVLFHNVKGEVKYHIPNVNGYNQAEADVIIKYLTSLRKVVDDCDISLTANPDQIALVRSHFDSSVDVFSRLFYACYCRVNLVSFVNNGSGNGHSESSGEDSDVEDDECDEVDERELEDNEKDDDAESETSDEGPCRQKDRRNVFDPTFLNKILSKTSELVVVVGNAATMEQNPAWKQFIDYCRDNNSYIG